jgi:hypothetical protein
MAEVAAFEKQTERSESWPLGGDFKKNLRALGELLLPVTGAHQDVEGPRFICPDAVSTGHRATASGKRVAAAVTTILVRQDVDYAQRKVVSKLQGAR